MNKTITLGLALLAALVIPHAAQAQSNVVIYGRLNTSIESQKFGNKQSIWAEQDNNSRWGVRGTEDLGGGLRAGFQLESAISSDTGAASSTFWNRQSEVFLGDSSLGRIRLGRYTSEAYYATADYVSNHNHDTGTSADALYSGFARANNAIGYESPAFVPGLRINVATALGEGVARRTNDLAVNYQTGPLALGFGYDTFASAAAAARNTVAHQYAFRAYYTMGPFGFGGYVQRDQDAFAAGSRTNVRLSAMYTLDASEFHVNVGSAGNTGSVANTGARQYTLAYNYNLSKRTKVYAFVTKINDDAASLYGGDFRSVAFGVRHNF